MEKFLKYLMLTIVATFSLTVTSCGGDDDEPDSSGTEDVIKIPAAHQWIYDKLNNTSWTMISTNRNYGTANYNQWKNAIITFSGELLDNKNELWRKFYITGFSGEGYWYVNDDGQLVCLNSWYVGGGGGLSASDAGAFVNVYGSMVDVDIQFPNSNTFIITDEHGDWWKYSQVSYQGGNGGSSGGSSGNNYETPEIGFYDYTATKTSVTVTYCIYNKSDCGGVSSATIYYGKNSATSSKNATVSGNYISTTITGLQSGTTYYVKCKVNTPGGSETTEQTKVITNY